MKLINTLVFTAVAGLLCGASYEADAAESSTTARPVLLAQAGTPIVSHGVESIPQAKSAGERGARLAAAHGPEALRRYIDRTRMIHALQYSDFARE